MRRGTKAYLAASIIAQVSALVRYVILARMLGPHELGLAATLILTSQFFEAVSDTGANRFIVQDARGDTRSMQGVVHLALGLRGVFIALGLAVSSTLVANLYRAPMLAPALIVLGLAPLIMGLMHLDVRRSQRTGDFRPEAYSTICGEITSTLVTGCAALILCDHTAILYGLIARAAVMVLVSHLTAKRLYNWAFDRADAAQFSRFAIPLFANGLLFFLGSQGDRLIVAGSVGPTGLGHYSAILLLVYYPASSISRFLTGIHLPQMAATRDIPERFAVQRRKFVARVLLVSTAMLVGFALVAPIVTPILYGKQFAQPVALYAILGLLQGARLFRIWPNVLALAVGDSVTVLVNNIVRNIALPLALVVSLIWPSIYAIVTAFIIGEVLAMLVAFVQLARRRVITLAPELFRMALFIAVGGAAVGCATAIEFGDGALAAAAALACAGLLAVMAMRERQTLIEGWGLVTRRLAGRGAP